MIIKVFVIAVRYINNFIDSARAIAGDDKDS